MIVRYENFKKIYEPWSKKYVREKWPYRRKSRKIKRSILAANEGRLCFGFYERAFQPFLRE